jgi:hypothetical protein
MQNWGKSWAETEIVWTLALEAAWLLIVSRRDKRVLGVNQHNTALEIITIIIGGGLIIVVPLGA